MGQNALSRFSNHTCVLALEEKEFRGLGRVSPDSGRDPRRIPGVDGSLYGRGLLSDAAVYVDQVHAENPRSFWGNSTVGLSFVGGCTLPALIFIPWLWRRKFIPGIC